MSAAAEVARDWAGQGWAVFELHGQRYAFDEEGQRFGALAFPLSFRGAVAAHTQEGNVNGVDLYALAVRRVNETPELDARRDVILYDWREGAEHLQWVATAAVSEVVAWADGIAAASWHGGAVSGGPYTNLIWAAADPRF